MSAMKLEFQDEKSKDDKFVIDTNKGVPGRRQPFLVDQVPDDVTEPKRFTKPIPKSDLLSRLGEFLPKLKKSNEDLLGRNPEDLNIEQVPEGSKYIQMDLGLGVFDTRPKDSPDTDTDDIRLTTTDEPRADSIVSFFGQDSGSDGTTDEESDTDKEALVTEI